VRWTYSWDNEVDLTEGAYRDARWVELSQNARVEV
jgi:hypothetical protein